MKALWTMVGWWLCLGCLAACQSPAAPPTVEPASPTIAPAPTPTRNLPQTAADVTFVTVATDAPDASGEFISFDAYGAPVGFDVDIMQLVAERLGITYEFIFTPYDGLLDQVAAGAFDLAIGKLAADRDTHPAIAYTTPYLELGEVLVVLANESSIVSYRDLQPGMKVGYVQGTAGQAAVDALPGLEPADRVPFPTAPAALQALRFGDVRGAVIDLPDALYFTDQYYQQFKIAGQGTPDELLTRVPYAMAVASDNTVLLHLVNQAINQMRASGQVEELARRWLVTDQVIDAGESLIGTPDDRLVIGMVRGAALNLDPAAPGYNFQEWEIRTNLMSGLYRYDDDGALIPALAEGMPQVSADGREVVVTLRDGITFSDGAPLTAQLVKAALDRSAANGAWLINGFVESTEVVDDRSLRFFLNDVYGYFPTLLAMPPYYIVSNPQCTLPGFTPGVSCSGIGPYRVVEWEGGVALRLEANPQWSAIGGAEPVFAKVEVRFYPDSTELRRSLESGAIDLAWDGLDWSDVQALRSQPAYRFWQGKGIFKSYLVFEHNTPPWDDARVRQAAAYAVDREALASQVFSGSRLPLYSPIPNGNPAQIAAEPQRDLDQAVALLNQAGYSEDRPLAIELWYLNDGRYTTLEGEYAQAIKVQLEETGIFRVTLQGESWDNFRGPMSTCQLPAFLLGWPPPGDLRYVEPMNWLAYFVTNTVNVCSNYESPAMAALVEQVRLESNEINRRLLYQQIQTLWAQEYPTLDLTQSLAYGVGLAKVSDVQTDLLGLLRYDQLNKGQ